MSKAPALSRDDENKIDDVRQLIDDFAQEVADYIGDKSEKWQESETGQSWSAWLDQINELIDALERFPMKREE